MDDHDDKCSVRDKFQNISFILNTYQLYDQLINQLYTFEKSIYLIDSFIFYKSKCTLLKYLDVEIKPLRLNVTKIRFTCRNTYHLTGIGNSFVAG